MKRFSQQEAVINSLQHLLQSVRSRNYDEAALNIVNVTKLVYLILNEKCNLDSIPTFYTM